MASVLGSLEERELAVRQWVEALREQAEKVCAELKQAETEVGALSDRPGAGRRSAGALFVVGIRW
ncbi:hypothetical protein [Streptomyces inhibens]|uniref:hypothetical protein n=1 Tax=Streptomyces inhibens TaxID=2293571 RepID=UPI001FD2F8E6|nr:hypothetical protein [Streptomyces inhibens]